MANATASGPNPARVPAIDEPILEMGDIQGIAIPGFFKPQQVLLHVRLPTGSPPEVLLGFQRFLHHFAASSGIDTLADRRAHRGGVESTETVLSAVGLTFTGLKRLVPDAEQIESPGFRLGLPARSALLGDPRDHGNPGHPANWEVGAIGQELDALFVFAGDIPERVAEAASAVARSLGDIGMSVERQVGSVRPDKEGHEHFGFDDGASQPGIRGRASDDPADFVTPRSIDPSAAPFAASMYPKSGGCEMTTPPRIGGICGDGDIEAEPDGSPCG